MSYLIAIAGKGGTGKTTVSALAFAARARYFKKSLGRLLPDRQSLCRFIGEHAQELNIRDMCMAFQISRSGFYSWMNRVPSERVREEKSVLIPAIRSIFTDSRQTYGSVRIGDALRDLGYHPSRRRVSRMMRQQHLVPRQIRHFRGISKPGPDTSHIQDLVKRDFTASGPNKVWVGDMTEIVTLEGILYLAFILDLFSRYVVGWATAENKDAQVVISALTMAVSRRQPPRGFTFHSDHASQYGSALFQAILKCQGGYSQHGQRW